LEALLPKPSSDHLRAGGRASWAEADQEKVGEPGETEDDLLRWARLQIEIQDLELSSKVSVSVVRTARLCRHSLAWCRINAG
jgi:hypothetical protein